MAPLRAICAAWAGKRRVNVVVELPTLPGLARPEQCLHARRTAMLNAEQARAQCDCVHPRAVCAFTHTFTQGRGLCATPVDLRVRGWVDKRGGGALAALSRVCVNQELRASLKQARKRLRSLRFRAQLPRSHFWCQKSAGRYVSKPNMLGVPVALGKLCNTAHKSKCLLVVLTARAKPVCC